MVSYLRQVAICESVRKRVEQALAGSDDVGTRLKAANIPSYDGILRAVSLLPGIDTEERLRDFITEHLLSSLRLNKIQREHLGL